MCDLIERDVSSSLTSYGLGGLSAGRQVCLHGVRLAGECHALVDDEQLPVADGFDVVMVLT